MQIKKRNSRINKMCASSSLINVALLAVVLLQVFIWSCNSVQIVQVFSDSDPIGNNEFNRGRKKNFEIGARVEG